MIDPEPPPLAAGASNGVPGRGGPLDDDHTVVARRGRRAPEPGPAAEAVDDATQVSVRRSPADPVDDATQVSVRRSPADPVDDATQLSVRRSPADPVDDATRLSVRRTPVDPVDDATRLSVRRTPADPVAQDSGPARTTSGSATYDRTGETILRSVRRTPPPAPDPEPQQSAGVARRAAYVPGGEASDLRLPRRPDAIRATRQPVAPPSSVAPAPAPEAVVAGRRRERRRLLIASGIAVLVLTAAAVALVLLLI